ncbi:hypothetical protein [Tengunoibacter tsumagoiensis]|uniref:Uncharacterized protein n=1 Tax=Tengunoibacter tsumagoiensis TaxID=2014871 RepID=A0A402A5G9_9CHLR|nr:hypothetical protein [Tengunoibacter tsumagoiensis]GCE14211.1 hypothetical protein KTT_40700 [Tengunoibacter tsumagoiensis]GCE14265.1 hypothetical protein KTT_41240 [Tengunoibacter tsumagoiensis]
MTTIPTLPDSVLLLLPLLVTVIAGWLSQDTLAPWINALISAVVMIACAALAAMFTDRLVGDLSIDFMLIVAYCYALIKCGVLAPLYRFLLARPSPIAPILPASKVPTVTDANKIATADTAPMKPISGP